MNGYALPVHKDAEWTSHDAVRRLRSALRVREIGHAGSLDPFAIGLLVCGVGRGTKVLSHIMELPKEYTGTIRLGVVTDSGDSTGEVIRSCPGPVRIDLHAARAAAARFTGSHMQVPPMLSALKRKGERLYDLARKGVVVARPPRPVQIHAFEILAVEGDLARFRVSCGKGTYVRSLAADFGDALGVGGCVASLRRTRIGSFTDDDSVSLRRSPGEIRADCAARAVPLADALAHLPALTLRPDWVRRVRRGEQPPWNAAAGLPPPPARWARLLGPEGELIATASIEAVPGPADRPWPDSWELRLERVL